MSKPDLTYCPINALVAVGNVLTKGHEKYPDETWRKLPVEKHLSAALRHIAAHQEGTFVDKESKELHLAHAACRLLFALGLTVNTKEETKLSNAFIESDVGKMTLESIKLTRELMEAGYDFFPNRKNKKKVLGNEDGR